MQRAEPDRRASSSSCQRLPQLATRPRRSGLHGSLRDAEQGRGFLRGESVEHRGLHHRSELGGEATERGAEVAVFDARAAPGPRRKPRRWSSIGRTTAAGVPPEAVDQPADADAPDPRGNLAGTAVATGAPPHRHERVLHDFLHEAGVRASARQAHHEPGRVPPVERLERCRSPWATARRSASSPSARTVITPSVGLTARTVHDAGSSEHARAPVESADPAHGPQRKQHTSAGGSRRARTLRFADAALQRAGHRPAVVQARRSRQDRDRHDPGRRQGRAVAKGIRKTKSRFGARLEPFTHVDLMLYRGRGALDTVTQAEIIAPHMAIRERPRAVRRRRDDARGRRQASPRSTSATCGSRCCCSRAAGRSTRRRSIRPPSPSRSC